MRSSFSSAWLLAAFLAVTLIFLVGEAAAAGPFETSGSLRWIVFASRQDADEAIGIARNSDQQFGPVQVLSTTNGWFAIAAGPLSVPDAAALKKKLSTSWAPKDAFLSRGQTFLNRIWQSPKSPVLAEASSEDGKAHISSAEGVEAQVGAEGNRKFVLVRGGGQAAKIQFDEEDAPYVSVGAIVAQLDRSSSLPQVVTTYYSGGAHCSSTGVGRPSNLGGSTHPAPPFST